MVNWFTGDHPKPVGSSTWDLTWCRPCKIAHPDEPVHEDTDCPRRCPTACDDDCGMWCHATHHVLWKRDHNPDDCPAVQCADAIDPGDEPEQCVLREGHDGAHE